VKESGSYRLEFTLRCLIGIYVDKLAFNFVVTGGVVMPEKDGVVDRNI